MTTLREYALTLLVTAAVTYLLTPLVRRGAIAAGAMHAARDRDVHVVPIPLLGGLAMYVGLAAGLLVAGQLTPLRTVFTDSPRMATGLLLAGGLIVIIGMVDDRWGLSPISKLAAQAAAGGILVWSGAQLSWLPEPGQGTLALTPNQSTALTILVVVATINAVNFIDGLDGLAAGIVCIAALSFFVYYYRLTQLVHLPLQAGPDAGLRGAGRGLPGVPAAQLLPGPDLHGRHRLDAARAAAGLRADLEHRLARPGQPARQQHREPVPRDPAAAAARRDHGDPVRGPAAGRGPADPGGPGRRWRRTASTCTTGCSTSGTRTAPAS